MTCRCATSSRLQSRHLPDTDRSAKDWLAAKGNDRQFGSALRRTLQRMVEAR